MQLLDRSISIAPSRLDFPSIETEIAGSLEVSETPVRIAVTKSTRGGWDCELGIISGEVPYPTAPLFDFRKRNFEASGELQRCYGGANRESALKSEGHAGDATPAAIALAQVSDTLITHPNVVNASDINELPGNGLYVEGSVLSRLLMGTVGLRNSACKPRARRTGRLPHRTLRSLHGQCHQRSSRATYGLNCAGIARIEPALRLIGGYTQTGRASGSVEGFQGLMDLLNDRKDTYDAVAVASVVEVPQHYHMDYFTSGGEMVNPWGGVEAMLTHAVSSIIDVPTAHAPMMESDDIAAVDPGVVDARMAAEVISITFFQSVLKGLQRSPRIVTDESMFGRSDVLTVEDVSCLVTPEGCLGLPTLAALHQGVPVIEVRENRNLMSNNLAALPWQDGQFYSVDNYWEAAGIVSALKAGIDPDTMRRPIETMRTRFNDDSPR